MRILALDLGTKCGWAYITPEKGINSGTWNLTPSRFDSAAIRFNKFQSNLEFIMGSSDGYMVVSEEYSSL